ncbi:hypothetical protein [Amycolatopsis sp. H20-H5]|uniref:hypothetical protein n=1 Tax=Amycolatopsis sp. H20-H5 TaxID=3046309 RepID=UPI002DB9E771|nr:hypothetical protein [Amycolatopsis sp. H20-H5]MEC3977899.1 hypothetical protein [Amycolatopsis sp. H20-H5]
MPTYERIDESGTVVERVNLIDGSYEHTRIGMAAMEGRSGWRTPPKPTPDPPPEPQDTKDNPTAAARRRTARTEGEN